MDVYFYEKERKLHLYTSLFHIKLNFMTFNIKFECISQVLLQKFPSKCQSFYCSINF